MKKINITKPERQKILSEKVKENPFLTDEDLASLFAVSIPTIRLDRLELKIPELRERIKNVAEDNYQKVKSLSDKEIIGELVDIKLNERAISVLDTDKSMVFEKTKIVRGHYIYSLAESLAIAVIDAEVALVGVANIKYKVPVYAGARIVAKAKVRKDRGSSFIVWVNIFNNNNEVFRGKFILVTIENKNKK